MPCRALSLPSCHSSPTMPLATFALARLRQVAVAMEKEGLVSRDEAVLMVEPRHLDQLLHPMFEGEASRRRCFLRACSQESSGTRAGCRSSRGTAQPLGAPSLRAFACVPLFLTPCTG